MFVAACGGEDTPSAAATTPTAAMVTSVAATTAAADPAAGAPADKEICEAAKKAGADLTAACKKTGVSANF